MNLISTGRSATLRADVMAQKNAARHPFELAEPRATMLGP
jgi:hypothetical protein